MFSKLRIATLGAIAAQALIVHTAHADTTDAVVIGIVRDTTTQKGLPGVPVVVTSPKMQGERTVVTDKGGYYRIPNLPPGEYTLTVLGTKDKPVTRSGLVLRANTTIRQDVSITPGGEEVRKIEVAAPTVDIGSSSSGMRIDGEFSRRVPVVTPSAKGGAQRSFESVAAATPQAKTDTYGMSVAGTTSPENSYQVDGVTVGSPAYGTLGMPLSMEFIEQVDVANGGYMPEFGRSGGGVLTATTKTGSNEFHGGVWAYYTPGQIEGKRRTVIRRGSTLSTTPKLGWIGDVGFDVGGRIIKDKLWFYAGFDIARTKYNMKTQWNRLQTNADGTPMEEEDGTPITEVIPGSDRIYDSSGYNIQGLAKLTWGVNENHTVNLTGIVAPYFSGGKSAFGIDPQQGIPEVMTGSGAINGTFDALAHQLNGIAGDLLLNWQATALNSALTFDTTVGWHHQQDDRLASDGAGPGEFTGLGGVSTVIYRRTDPHSLTEFEELPDGADQGACDPVPLADGSGTTEVCPINGQFPTLGPGQLSNKTSDRIALQHIIGYTVRGAGHHNLKLGVSGDYLSYTNARGYSGRRMYREHPSGTNFLDYRQYGYLTAPDQEVVLDKLEWTTKSVGVGTFLQDSWSIMDVVTLNAGVRWDGQFLWDGANDFLYGFVRQVSPRVGLIYDFTQKGKSKIFANYARYYQGIVLDIADRSGSSEPLLASVRDASLCDPSIVAEQNGACREDAALLQAGGAYDPNQNWIVLSAGKTPADPNLRSMSSDEVIAGAEYEVFKDARVGAGYNRRWLVSMIEDMSRDEANTYFVGNPGFGIAEDFPKAERTYDAVTVYFQKEFSKHWLAAASYTAAWLRGNISGLFRPENGQLDPNINSDFDLLSLLANRTGYLPGDVRNQIKVFGAGEIPLPARNFLMLGLGFQANSGGPTNFLGSHPLYGAGEAFILPRGSGDRLPWLFNIDTNIGYRYAFNEDVSIGVTMDVFNIANFQKETLVDQNYTLQDVLPIDGGTRDDLEGLTDLDGNPVVQNQNYGQPTAFQRPRQFRFGIRLTF